MCSSANISSSALLTSQDFLDGPRKRVLLTSRAKRVRKLSEGRTADRIRSDQIVEHKPTHARFCKSFGRKKLLGRLQVAKIQNKNLKAAGMARHIGLLLLCALSAGCHYALAAGRTLQQSNGPAKVYGNAASATSADLGNDPAGRAHLLVISPKL